MSCPQSGAQLRRNEVKKKKTEKKKTHKKAPFNKHTLGVDAILLEHLLHNGTNISNWGEKQLKWLHLAEKTLPSHPQDKTVSTLSSRSTEAPELGRFTSRHVCFAK